MEKMFPEAVTCVGEYLGRSSWIFGRHRGKAYAEDEILKGLGINRECSESSNDNLRKRAVQKALQFFKDNPSNPEEIVFIAEVGPCGDNCTSTYPAHYYKKY